MRQLSWALAAVAIAASTSISLAQQAMWVNVDTLNRRTCPSQDCGVVGKIFFRQKVEVFETSRGWARITHSYDAACVGGRSQYVDKGPAQCEASNGITEGQFAEWVMLEYLVASQPPDPAETASADERIVANSDHFATHRIAFAKAARDLIAKGQCTEKDFLDWGGWIKSSNHSDAPVYFTYCRDGSDRVYLDVSTGRIFR